MENCQIGIYLFRQKLKFTWIENKQLIVVETGTLEIIIKFYFMKYSKFVIKNFKGIKELTLDLEKEPKSKVFTLVGLNESGKTSILEAINLFQEIYPTKDRHKLIPKSEKNKL
jgi:ABC-type polysaccharide/polyol phosphate transport system ATPase subunit